MGPFASPLNVRLLNGGELGRLLTEFVYQDQDGRSVRVEAGFETDFASVRPLRDIAVGLLVLSMAAGLFRPVLGALIGAAGYGALALYASVVGYGNAAAIVHDWLYATKELSRKESDQVFYRALRASGVSRWRASLMYIGVRLGGRRRYKRNTKGRSAHAT